MGSLLRKRLLNFTGNERSVWFKENEIMNIFRIYLCVWMMVKIAFQSGIKQKKLNQNFFFLISTWFFDTSVSPRRFPLAGRTKVKTLESHWKEIFRKRGKIRIEKKPEGKRLLFSSWISSWIDFWSGSWIRQAKLVNIIQLITLANNTRYYGRQWLAAG